MDRCILGYLKYCQQHHVKQNCLWQHLNNKINLKEMIDQAIIATRQLCKRQSTWLRSEKDALTLETPDIAKALEFLEK